MRSCDSNLAIMQAINNVDISTNFKDKKLVDNYFDSKLDTSQIQLAIDNIKYMMNMMNDEKI